MDEIANTLLQQPAGTSMKYSHISFFLLLRSVVGDDFGAEQDAVFGGIAGVEHLQSESPSPVLIEELFVVDPGAVELRKKRNTCWIM
jgi:hypothetical protein